MPALARLVARPFVLGMLAIAAAGGVAHTARAAAADLPENLARRAQASATSEHNASYLAKFAIDGRIPGPGSQTADLNAAWCVLKAKTGDAADFTLTWDQPVEIAEVVYFGRTAWFMNECFRAYQIYLDDAPAAVAQGEFQILHGPQNVPLGAARTAKKLTIKFLNSHGGMNPGAAEIMVFGRPLTKPQFAQLKRQTGAVDAPAADSVEPAALADLIRRLQANHGPQYARAAEHLQQLESLARQPEGGAEQALARLQRAALLFDVDRLLVIKRHEITASHVYTYHYEGQQNGGGLYVLQAADPAAKALQLVDSTDGQILDCDLSYDARQVLFSWRRKSGEGYHLWTVNCDGSGLKQLTDGAWHDYNGCWLPDGGIAFLSTRQPQFAYCWHAAGGDPAPHGGRRVEPAAAVGQLPERLHPLRAGRRPDHFHAVGVCRPPGHSDPELVDAQPGRLEPGRLLRQPRAVARHVHGGSANPRHDQDHLHHDRP